MLHTGSGHGVSGSACGLGAVVPLPLAPHLPAPPAPQPQGLLERADALHCRHPCRPSCTQVYILFCSSCSSLHQYHPSFCLSVYYLINLGQAASGGPGGGGDGCRLDLDISIPGSRPETLNPKKLDLGQAASSGPGGGGGRGSGSKIVPAGFCAAPGALPPALDLPAAGGAAGDVTLL